MTHARTLELLNCLLRTLCRSLAQYVCDARPWTPPDRRPLADAIADLAADQQHYAAQVAEAIEARDNRPEPDTFPLDYTAINDLSIDYLLRVVLEGHHRDMAELERCAAELSEESDLRTLAGEILGNARGHAEILAKFAREAVASG